MLPNIMPENYKTPSTLQFPLYLTNNRGSIKALIGLLLAMSAYILFLFLVPFIKVISSEQLMNISGFITSYSPIPCLLALIWCIKYPPQKICLDGNYAIVTPAFELWTQLAAFTTVVESKKIPLNVFDYISIQNEFLFGTSFLAWREMGMGWQMLSQRKIVLHVRQSEEKVAFNCPIPSDIAYAMDLAALLNITAKI